MSLKDHPFFKALEDASRMDKISDLGKSAFGLGGSNKNLFFKALKQAHPFIFDKKVTFEKRCAAEENGSGIEFEELATEFSLPFKTSLYLMTDSPILHCPVYEGATETGYLDVLGYLIQEINPEKFIVFEVSMVDSDNKDPLPAIYQYELDLKTIETMSRHMKAIYSLTEEGNQLNRTIKTHVFKQFHSIFQFTKAISVKRIGIEKVKNFSVKSRGIGTGFTAVKMDNLIHIADKVEYEYTTPLEEANINWNYVGFWRGHWRAFYVKDAQGDNRKDDRGWNMVDYGKTGKNRQGEYVVSGYTWVVEYTRGNAALAEIKTRIVVNKSGGKI